MVQAPNLLHALLELGVCNSGDLDEAQARQIIFGGELELCLLELQVAREQDLLAALAKVTRGTVAAAGPLLVEREASTAVRAVVADAVAGIGEDGSVLISLPGEPSEDERQALGAACRERPSLVQCTTRLRLLEAQAELDGLVLDPRIERELKRTGRVLGGLQPPPPPLSLPAVPQPQPLPAVPPPLAGPPPGDSSLSELSRLIGNNGPAIAVAPLHVAVSSAVTPAPESKAADETAPPPAGYQELARSVIPPPLSAEKARPPSQHPDASPAEPAYPQKQALSDLGAARDKDVIVSTICRFCAQFFEYVAVFGIQASEARGLVASGPGKSSERIHDLRIPLDVPSVLSRAKETGQHRVARLRAGGLEGGLVRDLERPLGRAVLLLPITVQARTLLLIWADDGVDDVDIEHALPVLGLVRTASAALERVLIERKRASRLARPSLVPGAAPARTGVTPAPTAPRALAAPEAAPLPAPPAPESPVPEKAASPTTTLGVPKPVRSSAPPAEAPQPVVEAPAAPSDARPAFDTRPTRIGMSIPPAGTRRLSSAPPDARATAGKPPLDPRHETKRDLAPPEARTSAATKPDLPRSAPEAPKKRKLRESFSDVEARGRSDPSAAPVSSDPPLAFPTDFPRTMKGYPGEVRLKPTASPVPKVAPPLLSRRIVALSEQAQAEQVQAEQAQAEQAQAEQPPGLGEGLVAPPASAGTMLSRRPEMDSPPPRISDKPPAEGPPARPSPAPLSYRALVGKWLSGEEEALQRLVEGGESAVGALIAAFPGPVQEPEGPRTRASECGPVLKAIAAIGNKATPFLTVRTADEDAFVRRWAVFMLGELPGRDAARAIADRLLDETVDVRRAALASARRVQSDGLTRRTLRARLEEMTRDAQLMTDERCAAVEAIADIREHESIPTLLQLLDDESGAVKRAARWALSVLTRHDFEDNVAEWREFWQRHRNEPRSEWLLLALKNTQGDLARAAADEVESLIGSPVGDIERLTEDTIAHLREKLRQTPA